LKRLALGGIKKTTAATIAILAISAIPIIASIVGRLGVDALECGLHQLSAGSLCRPLCGAATAPDLVEHLDLSFVDTEFLDHVFAEDDVGALALEVDLFESRDLGLIEDLPQAGFGGESQLVHGFASGRSLLGALLSDLRIFGNPPVVLVSAPVASAAATLGVLLAAATEAAATPTALGVGVAISTSAPSLRPTAARAPGTTHLCPVLVHLGVVAIVQALDLSLLLVFHLQLDLDGFVGRQLQERPSRTAGTATATRAAPTTRAAETSAARTATAAIRWLGHRVQRQGRQRNQKRRCGESDSQS
jgi:hypothetical protein